VNEIEYREILFKDNMNLKSNMNHKTHFDCLHLHWEPTVAPML